MKKKSLLVVGICLVVMLVSVPFISACAGKAPGAAPDAIKIGYSISLTGIYAAGGESQQNSTLLWGDYVNETKGGIYVKEYDKKLPVQLVFYDDKSTPAEAVKIYERLATADKVDILLGNWSTALQNAVIPTIEKHKIPCVGSNSGSLTWYDLKADYFWCVGTNCNADMAQAGVAELLSANRDQINTVAILYCNDVRPLEDISVLEPMLQKENFNIVLKKDYPIGVTDLANTLIEIKGKNPDALIALSYPADTILMMKQMPEIGLDPKFYYGLVGPGISPFHMIFNGAENGVCMMGMWTNKSPGDSQLFYDMYLERYEMPPDHLDSVHPWAAGEIIEQAIAQAGSLDKEKLRKVIDTSSFDTILGKIEFDGVMFKDAPHSVLQWQNGKVEIVWPPEIATAQPMIPKPAWPK